MTKASTASVVIYIENSVQIEIIPTAGSREVLLPVLVIF